MYKNRQIYILSNYVQLTYYILIYVKLIYILYIIHTHKHTHTHTHTHTHSHTNIYIYIFQIVATNIISSPVGLSLKYNNQIVCNSNPATACYESAISTLSNFKNLFFSSINFKTSINRLNYENTFSMIWYEFIFLHKILFKLYAQKANVLIVPGITYINFFSSSNLTLLHNGFILIWNYS